MLSNQKYYLDSRPQPGALIGFFKPFSALYKKHTLPNILHKNQRGCKLYSKAFKDGPCRSKNKSNLFESPSGDIVQIVTVWIILKSESVPRFITAYPGGWQ
jgi:hypothetical protein